MRLTISTVACWVFLGGVVWFQGGWLSTVSAVAAAVIAYFEGRSDEDFRWRAMRQLKDWKP